MADAGTFSQISERSKPTFGYRIADGRHPIFDPTGAMLHGGRWNSAGRRVIYAAKTYAGAMLEVLVHANFSQPPKNHQLIRSLIPEAVSVETLASGDLANWMPRTFQHRVLSAMSGFGPAERQCCRFRV